MATALALIHAARYLTQHSAGVADATEQRYTPSRASWRATKDSIWVYTPLHILVVDRLTKMPLLTIVFTDVVASSATKRDLSLGRDSSERDKTYGSLVFPGVHNSMIFRVNKEYPYKSSWTLWNKCVTFKIP